MEDDSQYRSQGPSDDVTSEVGLPETQQERATGQSEHISFENECDRWKYLFEMQQRNMMELIRTLQEPRVSEIKITLPEFNPDDQDSDARAWCETVDLCLQERPISGSNLIITMSKALKGSASSWLAQSSYPGITWPQLKYLFLARFDIVETPAANLWRLLNSSPREGECLSAYASRFMSAITARWKALSTEQIAIALTLAHATKIDTRLQRIAFTSEIDTRSKLQRELMAFTFRKRGPPLNERSTSAVEAKRPRIENGRRCYNCGKLGHVSSECRGNSSRDSNANPRSEGTGTTPVQQLKDVGAPRKTITPTCFNCGEPGHIATRCPLKDTISSGARTERRVDICTLQPATDQLLDETGEAFPFCFDSGAECSLIKQSLVDRLSGKRKYNAVTLLGLGSARINCNIQILSTVSIQGYSVQLLFHVVPDSSISNDVIIGRDLLTLGFSIEIFEKSLVLKKVKVVSICDVGLKVINFEGVDSDVPDQEKTLLISLLKQNSSYFIEGTPIARVSTGKLVIKLIDPNRTVQRRPYRLSPEERCEVRNQIKELLSAGIIRESCSPFASPILLVKKKDGTDRLCVDYRELNSNTVPDRYPLPLISDQIQRLVGANYFTSLDMACGYHQILVEEDSIERTAFVTPDGQFEYLSMPFGLRNAPSVYQRAINKALGVLTESFAVVYIDDVIIPSCTVHEGIERLQIVLKALTDAGFLLNIKKCAFLKTRVEFLGFEVSAGEIRPNPRKIRALTELSPPQTVTQLRQIIGLASYFRQFVPRFSQKAALYGLTSGKGKIHWTLELEKVRQDIISILTDKPVLMIFDPKLPTELHTDASAEGYGAILMQRIDGKLHVVEYYSRRTSSAESKYHSYELETLAVVNAVKHFRHYLHGRKFTVVTDCNAVKASKSKADLTPRVHRWWCFLQAFDFDVEYRQGKHMSHVDFFSRNPLPTVNGTIRVQQKRINLTEISDNWLLAEQHKDDEIKSIITKLEANELNSDIAKTYEIRRGLLYRKIDRNNKNYWLPIVPRAFQWAIINHVHESVMHLSWEKTLEKVYCHFRFPNMNKYVRKFVDNCITCRVAKSSSGKIQAELHPIPKITAPWHTIHMDATGKLSGKKDTKEYVFVSIDGFTKYVILHHTRKIDTQSAIKALKYNVSLFGTPTRVIADQGRCFAGREFVNFCNTHNINLHLIATGTSRANGQVERVMSTLKNMLTAVEPNENRSWQDALPDIQLAINCTMNRVTKASPLELLIGKVARPLSLMALGSDDIEIDLESIREQLAQQMEVNACSEKIRFDKSKAKVKKFKVGDYVLLKNHERNQTKLDPKFKGPYRVIELLDGDRYLVKALNSDRTYKYAHDRVRAMPECYVPLELSSALETPTNQTESECAEDGVDNTQAHEDV